MKIEQKDPNNLIEYAFNNRVHSDEQIDLIANSIKEFGFNQPIVVDEDNIILVGHGRLRAAKKLNLKQVPVLKLSDLDEVKKRAYRILDNKIQTDSEWDLEGLNIELPWLENEGFDLEAWGLNDLKLESEPEIEVSDDEFEPTEQTEIYIKLGDLIELGKHRVLCGDSTINGHEVIADMIITDPPYGVAYVGKTKDSLTIKNDNLDESSLTSFWTSALDVSISRLKDGGSLYVAVPPGPLRQCFTIPLKERGILRQELVWIKDSMVLGRSDYHYKHEPILYGWKPGAAHYFTDDRTKVSTLEVARPKRSTEHPTMKPLELWAQLISNSSRKLEKIYDPFLGSGTTLIAAEQLNRICYGIEIEPKYCQVIIERYRKYCLDNNKEFVCKINGEDFIPPQSN